MTKIRALLIILLLVVSVVFYTTCPMDPVISYNTVKETNHEDAVKEEQPKDDTISFIVLGDNLLHMPVVNSGKKADGSYEYSHLFSNLQPMISDADIAVIGQETVFGGEKFGYSGYPLFNSPSDMGKSLVNEGFDVILHASNHVFDKWAEGVENTLSFWESYPDVTVLGINKSAKAKKQVNIKEIKGAKIAMLNYTYSTNGLTVSQDKEYLVNMIDEEKIKADSEYAQDNADFTIAFMHWGTEYSIKPDASQKALAKKMCSWGVDLIIGAHPHVIEPVEWIKSDNGNKMLVYYSLGNFVSRQLEAINLLGGIADVKLKVTQDEVYIDSYKFLPIVTHYDTTYTDFSVYKLSDYTDELAKKHGVASHNGAVSVKRWRDMIDTVFKDYDMSNVE